ncbi:MAG: hypothetical protein WA908_03350 [Pontixanthobacter sp.]
MTCFRFALPLGVALMAIVSAPVSAEAESLNARNTVHAATMKVDDPNTLICVKKPVTTSRIKFTRDCRSSSAWKAYRDEVDATQRAMNNNR